MKVLLILLLSLVFSASAFAQNVTVPVQGFVTDAQGQTLDGATPMGFQIQDGQSAVLWAANRTVDVQDGHFSVYLGEDSVLDISVFESNGPFMLAITIDGDSLPLVDIGHAPFAAIAEKARDADLVNGLTAAEIDTQLTEAEVDAFVANNGYLSSVNWLDLVGVPADLLDGDDNTQLTEAQVDAYVANNGYASEAWVTSQGYLPSTQVFGGDVTGTYSSLQLGSNVVGTNEIDAAQVQRRVASTCAVGSHMTGVNVDGTVRCALQSGDISGNGARFYMPIFTASKTIANSGVYQNVAGNVGVGTTTVSHKLEVAGNTAADDFKYRSPQTRTHWITPSTLVWNGTIQTGRGSAYSPFTVTAAGGNLWSIDGGSPATAEASLSLPHGAVVTEISCGLEDPNNTTGLDFGIVFWRSDQSGNYTDIAAGSVTTQTTQTGSQTLTVTTEVFGSPLTETIDNNASQYGFFLQFVGLSTLVSSPTRPSVSRAAFHGCKITYSVDTLQ